MSGIHAREWISPAVVTYLIQRLVEYPENAGMFQDVDWYIMPVMNPDGTFNTAPVSNQQFKISPLRSFQVTNSPTDSIACGVRRAPRTSDPPVMERIPTATLVSNGAARAPVRICAARSMQDREPSPSPKLRPSPTSSWAKLHS